MIKKIRSFQRVFFFQNNFDSNESPKHVGKIFLMYILFSFAYYTIIAEDTNILIMFFIPIVWIYLGINKKIKLWDLVPVSSKFTISNIFFSFYYLTFMMIVFLDIFAIVALICIYLFSGGHSSFFLEAWNSFLSAIKGVSTIASIIGILVYFIMGNICITIFFVRNAKYRLISLGALFVIFFASAYVFKLTYNEKIFDALASIENINLKYILLVISSILFILSLFGGIKIALNLHRKIVINE
ncbi:hypothetical protein KPL40_00295 [Clostridium gasigenes]|uniref:hypothetical protein n=1 Tax=Clostridium gasigenes TaxID=94869 RepID=UPI001C0C9B40|nr:hypothetical protein [Clostridium gasigenes]MBU3130879.1 hypothetical protein [Clostridium gasigenes]